MSTRPKRKVAEKLVEIPAPEVKKNKKQMPKSVEDPHKVVEEKVAEEEQMEEKPVVEAKKVKKAAAKPKVLEGKPKIPEEKEVEEQMEEKPVAEAKKVKKAAAKPKVLDEKPAEKVSVAEQKKSKRQAVMKSEKVEESEEEKVEEESEVSEKPGKISVGSKLPANLQVVDENGNTHELLDLFKEKAGIIFFYPKANTPGCTTQACGFRDSHEDFQKKGYEIYGMSADSPTSQENWKKKHNFPYMLLSDRSKDRNVLKALGTNKSPSSVSRSHIIIGKGGVVQDIKYGVSPKQSVDEAKSFVKV